MAIAIEDGSGLNTDAESYLDAVGFRDLAVARGHSVSGYESDVIEEALRRATDFLEATGLERWKGVRYRTDQALAFPRVGVVVDGQTLPTEVIPQALLKALVEATIRELAKPGALTPDYTIAPQVIERTVGPITTKFSDTTKLDPAATVPRFDVIERLLAPLLTDGLTGSTGTRSRFVGRA
jgi:hypothetical protein